MQVAKLVGTTGSRGFFLFEFCSQLLVNLGLCVLWIRKRRNKYHKLDTSFVLKLLVPLLLYSNLLYNNSNSF